MSERAISPVHTEYVYTSEQESTARTLYEALGRARSLDRRIIAAVVADTTHQIAKVQEVIER